MKNFLLMVFPILVVTFFVSSFLGIGFLYGYTSAQQTLRGPSYESVLAGADNMALHISHLQCQLDEFHKFFDSGGEYKIALDIRGNPVVRNRRIEAPFAYYIVKPVAVGCGYEVSTQKDDKVYAIVMFSDEKGFKSDLPKWTRIGFDGTVRGELLGMLAIDGSNLAVIDKKGGRP